MASANTIAGWVTIMALGGAFYWVNNQRKNKNRRTVQRQPAKAADAKEEKPKKVRKGLSQAGGETETKAANGQKKGGQGGKIQTQETATTASPVDDADELDNREFARQLSQAKSGTIAAPKSQVSGRPKSVKQVNAQEKSAAGKKQKSEISGGISDDNDAVPNSPEPDVSTVSSHAANGDVSDMLEKPATPAGVLKVLPSINPSRPQSSKGTKVSEPVETKKQRQNRQKAQEAKNLRAQEEEVRKAKMEQQRRTAREAEGRAAKDGSAFMASKTTTPSAWSSTNGNTSTKTVELLDTYSAPSSGGASLPDPISLGSDRQDSANQTSSPLSEEEQVRKALDESEDWNVVKGKDKKSRARVVENQATSDDKSKPANDKKYTQPPPPSAPTKSSQTYETTPIYVGNGKAHDEKLDLEDSEWEVS